MGNKALGPDPMTWGRVLHLVRHGQYENKEGVFGGTLTALGRRQARRAGAFLRAWPISAVHSSDFCRAEETAELIAAQLGSFKVERHKMLREIQPTRIPGWKVTLEERRQGQASVQQIRNRFFRASAKPKHEVVVCHGNLIRYISAQHLGAPKTSWMNLGTYHCGITHVVVVQQRSILLSYNSIGHLPPALHSCR